METCRACVTSCPTGAIDSNRQLINSDRCLSLINEFAEEEFPEWIYKSVHNSIVDCIKCQDYCPANVSNKDNIEMGVLFTEEKTTEILNHKSYTVYTDSVASKIQKADIF